MSGVAPDIFDEVAKIKREGTTALATVVSGDKGRGRAVSVCEALVSVWLELPYSMLSNQRRIIFHIQRR